jgi:hypothetical protein
MHRRARMKTENFVLDTAGLMEKKIVEKRGKGMNAQGESTAQQRLM